MTASSTAPKQVKRSGSESAKRRITGPIPIAPAPGTSSNPNGESKIKTATRSKSGCMTCRIRRKKCDLERVGDSCKTCIRLRIECLGWGAKRPEALRDSNVVKECQNMIKIFLASNNMIKGSARASAVALLNAQPSAPQTSAPSGLLTTTYTSSEDNTNGTHDVQPQGHFHIFAVRNAYPQLSPPPSSPHTGQNGSSSPPSALAVAGLGAGAGDTASYVGQPFLRFDFLRRIEGSNLGTSASASNHLHPLLPAAPPSSSKRGRHGSNGTKHVEDIYPESEEGRDGLSAEGDDLDEVMEEPSSFPRHPSNYVGPPPQFQAQAPPPHHYQPQPEQDWSYAANSRPKVLPYQLGPVSPNGHYSHPHPPHPYAQSHLRSSYERDPFDKRQEHSAVPMSVPERLKELEREREREREELLKRNPMGIQQQVPPLPPSSHTFIYGPGVGVAAPGRINTGGFGQANYPSADPLAYANRSMDPYGGPPRLGGVNQDRQLLGPPLSMARTNSNSSNGAYIVDVTSPTPTVNAGSALPSPNPRFSTGGYTDVSQVTSTAGEMEMEGDLDGEPMPMPMSQSQMTNHLLPLRSSFGESYSFDRLYVDPDTDIYANNNSSSSSSNNNNNSRTANNNGLTLDSLASMVDPSMLQSLMSTLGVAQVPGGGFTGAAVSPTAWQQLQQSWVTPAPAPHVPTIYVNEYESKPVVFNSKHLQLLNAYRQTICHLQYHIAHTADPSLGDELFNLAMASESALLGTLTLTALFKARMRGVRIDEGSIDDGVSDTIMFRNQLGLTLGQKRLNPASVDEGDAMGSLHMLSAVLFAGGTDAEWDRYLDMAKMWVSKQAVVKKGSWVAGEDMSGLISPDGKVDKKNAFIIKATFWFDILGAVTMRREPQFLSAYEELFGRNGGSGMERIMGCDEKVLLAIAETAGLARWRKDMEDQGCLSVMELAQRAKKIEEKLTLVGPVYWGAGNGNSEGLFEGAKGNTTSTSSTAPELSLEDLLSGRGTNGVPSRQSGSGDSEATNNDVWAKHKLRLISNVFRATGRLYLHTVVSQCNPDVKEIKNGVSETIQAFRNLQMSDVDRSLVFPIALAGCLTDDRSYREYLVGRLRALGKEGEAVGNSRSCLLLMEKVWEKRDAGPSRIVDWIDTMKEMGWSLLLV